MTVPSEGNWQGPLPELPPKWAGSVHPETPTGATPATGHTLAGATPAPGQDFVTSVYLATQGAHTVGEVAYAGHTAEQGGKRICWEALDPAEQKRWQSAAAAVMLRAQGAVDYHALHRYRVALEAIAASDGTCGAKAREALEATP